MKEKPEKGCCAQKHFDAKNFLVFDAHLGRAGRSPGRDLDEINSFAAYAITLISPHRVYKVDLRDGRMKLVASQAVRLGFEDHVGLSAGPIVLDSGMYLVAGHIRRGGWGWATRMTFFYEFDPAVLSCHDLTRDIILAMIPPQSARASSKSEAPGAVLEVLVGLALRPSAYPL